MIFEELAEYLGKPVSDGDLDAVNALLHRGHADHLGIRYTSVGPDCVTAQLTVEAHHLQPMGLVHGGVFAALVEDTASVAASWWLAGGGVAVGTHNSTDFFRPVQGGELFITAKPLHRGRTQQIWVVDICQPQNRRVAQGRLRLSTLPIERD